ncbi:ATR [Bugula neritina]|uniref:ATR n=1 Tax=Bugula neritina TaxID=10212 RepID=A0A7J7JFA4_BUGNE|nr:ATR [Bugula neritina]
MLDAKQIESLLNSLCWHLEYSSFSVKMSTSLFLAELFATSSWIDKVSHIPVYNLMACIEVLIIHSLNSEDEDLRTAVTSLLRALSQSPAAHSMQLSMMLLESLAESSLRTLTECSLVSSLFDLLLSSMSSQSLVSLAMNKQLTEWIIIKIQTNEACESMICCLGDLIKCLPSAMAAATFAKVSVITESIARSATTAAQVTSSKISDLRFCCQIVTHCYLHWMTSFPAESKEEIVRGIKGLLNTLVVSWSQVLSLADRDLLSSLYSDVVHSISSLLALKDIIQERKLVIQLVIMASLPWLTENYTPDPEANFCVTEEVKSLALTLKPLLSDEILRVCLLSVIVASKEILPKWRLHILRTVSNFKRPVPLTAITKHLQYLLLDQGPPSFHLIYDLLHPVLSLQSCIVDESLAQVLGQLSCIVAGGAELSWKNVKCKTPVWDIDRVICKKCDVTEKQTLQSVDPGMFEPFIQLIYKDSHKIRLLMAAALPRLFSHIKISHANGETMNMLQTTLQLVEDTNRDVRVQFSTLPHRAFQHSSMEVIGQFVDKVLTINASTQDEEMKETLIMTVQSLGRVEDQNLLPICIRFLVESYLSSSQFVTATAFHYLQRLAEFRGLNPSQIYQKNQSMLAECLSEKVVEILSNRYSEELTVMDLFDRASKLFHYESPSLFITSLEKHIVPYLVSSEHTDIHQVLKLIANHVGKSYQQLITTNMKYIFSHLVRSCHRTTLEKKISYLEAETRLSIKSLLRQSFQGVLNQLLLYFGTRHQQIKLGLAFFLSQDGQTQLSSDNHVSDELLAEFIEKHLLGVLVEFDHILLQRSTDIKKKEDVISSLIHVIKLLGSRRVTSLRIKISTSLKLALTTTAGRLPKLCCEAWLCFVKHVEVASLKYMLSYIVVTLLPLIRTLPADVAPVLEYLVVKCRKELSSSFNELYFIPEVPQLSEVNAVLKNYMVFSGRPDAFPLQLKQYLAGVNHDNSEVSKQALIKLRQLLLDNRNQLYQMIGGAETVNPLVTEAMQKVCILIILLYYCLYYISKLMLM